ncbi:MAG: hypothetical protein ACLT33_07265 [Lachnospira pectinoschiza]
MVNLKTLVIEKDIANMGNLLLDNDNLKSKKNGSENMAYVGYSYRNEYKQEFNLIIMRKMRNQVARLQLFKKGASYF